MCTGWRCTTLRLAPDLCTSALFCPTDRQGGVEGSSNLIKSGMPAQKFPCQSTACIVGKSCPRLWITRATQDNGRLQPWVLAGQAEGIAAWMSGLAPGREPFRWRKPVPVSTVCARFAGRGFPALPTAAQGQALGQGWSGKQKNEKGLARHRWWAGRLQGEAVGAGCGGAYRYSRRV